MAHSGPALTWSDKAPFVMRIPAALFALLLGLSTVYPQPGEPDPGYGVGGFAITDAWQQTLPRVVKVHSDGGTVIGGFRYASAQTTGIVRLVQRFAERLFPQGEQRLDLAWPGDAARGAYVLTIIDEAGRVTVPVVR